MNWLSETIRLLAARSGKKTDPKVTCVKTSAGEFTRCSGGWEAMMTLEQGLIQILVDDKEGQPDAAFIERLPSILEALPSSIETASSEVAVTENHSFSIITDGSPQIGDNAAYDFSLGFSYEEEAWGETVFVDFRGSTVVRWSAVD